MAFVLDAGALIALDRRRDDMAKILAVALRTRTPVRVATAVVAQAWRDGRRQANLARALAFMSEVELERDQARRIGTLLQRARSDDVVDAVVIDIADDGDTVITSDPDDMARLARAAGRDIKVVSV